MNRIQLIFNEKWAMAREDYYNLVSLILPSIHSGNFKEVEAFFEKDTVTAYASDLNFVGRWNLEDSGLPSDSVAVIVLEGTLYAWETFRLQEYIAQAAANDRIAGIILWINGPGGMITGLDNASKMISECPKPVVAYIAGACASAHFWLASAADKRFLGSLMCEVGSIGVVGTYYNAKEALKKRRNRLSGDLPGFGRLEKTGNTGRLRKTITRNLIRKKLSKTAHDVLPDRFGEPFHRL